MRGRRATLASFGLEQKDAVTPDLGQSHSFEHTIVVPLLGVLHVKFFILVAVREDEDAVLRVDVCNGRPPDGQNVLVATVWPYARLEDKKGQGEWLGPRRIAFIEPGDPVGRGDARVIQPRCVNQVEVEQLVAARILGHAFHRSRRVEKVVVPRQPVKERRLAVTY